MSTPFKETNRFEPVNGSDPVYGRVMQNPYPVGTNPDPREILQLDMAELEMEDPLSSEYPYYDEPLVQDKDDESAHLQKTRPLPIN